MIYSRKLMDRERLRVYYQRRTRDERMGRFGGGWQWSVGVEVGETSMIVNLLVAYLRIVWGPRRILGPVADVRSFLR